MPYYYRNLFLLFLSLFFSACSTLEIIQIQVLKPAEINIPAKVKQVVFINHAIRQRQLNSSFSDSLLTVSYFDGLISVITSFDRYSFHNDSLLIIKKSDSNLFKSIDKESLRTICANKRVDAAIVLENFQISYTDPIKLMYSPEYGFYGTFKVENKAYWRFYDFIGDSIIDDYILYDTLFWDASGNYDYEVLQQFPDIPSAIDISCYYAGQKYGERICQKWKTEKRYLYVNTNNDFMQAMQLVRKGYWLNAFELWKKYAYAKNKKLAAMACFNMAVACEVLDNIDAALEWAAKSYFYKNDWYTESYITILEKRKKTRQLIEKQLQP